jgi:hypothetical protein
VAVQTHKVTFTADGIGAGVQLNSSVVAGMVFGDLDGVNVYWEVSPNDVDWVEYDMKKHINEPSVLVPDLADTRVPIKYARYRVEGMAPSTQVDCWFVVEL